MNVIVVIILLLLALKLVSSTVHFVFKAILLFCVGLFLLTLIKPIVLMKPSDWKNSIEQCESIADKHPEFVKVKNKDVAILVDGEFVSVKEISSIRLRGLSVRCVIDNQEFKVSLFKQYRVLLKLYTNVYWFEVVSSNL